MVRAPTAARSGAAAATASPSSHGLERKFKPWRRRQSRHASTQGSLKHQLRGQERLLRKLERQRNEETHNGNDDDDDDAGAAARAVAARLRQVRDRIATLTGEVAAREAQARSRQHARESHGKRFLERQILVRQEHRARQELARARDGGGRPPTEVRDCERRLRRLALDQAYVAHYYPTLARKYMPLFHNRTRRVDGLTALKRRAAIRQRILRALASDAKGSHQKTVDNDQGDNAVDGSDRNTAVASWITADMYERLPSDWSVQEERDLFGCLDDKADESKDDKHDCDDWKDDRFTVNPSQEALLQKALELEQEAEDLEDNQNDRKEDDEKVKDDSSSSSSSSSSDDESEEGVDPITEHKKRASNNLRGVCSSSGNSDDGAAMKADKNCVKDNVNSDDSSQSSSSSNNSPSDSSYDSDQAERNQKGTATSTQKGEREPEIHGAGNDDKDDDDFLLSSDAGGVDASTAFEQPKKRAQSFDQVRGDKSKGWQTQRQRLGQFKRKRPRDRR